MDKIALDTPHIHTHTKKLLTGSTGIKFHKPLISLSFNLWNFFTKCILFSENHEPFSWRTLAHNIHAHQWGNCDYFNPINLLFLHTLFIVQVLQKFKPTVSISYSLICLNKEISDCTFCSFNHSREFLSTFRSQSYWIFNFDQCFTKK
jgi:hypothetical protein